MPLVIGFYAWGPPERQITAAALDGIPMTREAVEKQEVIIMTAAIPRLGVKMA